MEAAEQSGPMFSFVDIAIISFLIGFGTYWMFFRKKKSADFDTSSIKTFSIE